MDITLYVTDPDFPEFEQEDEIVNGEGKIALSGPMLSLRKAYTHQEVASWVHACARELGVPVSEIFISREPKLDGMAVEICYRDGNLSHILSRGDGVVGENLSRHIDSFLCIPRRISKAGEVVVRGEIMLAHPLSYVNSVMSNIGDKTFKTHRNAVSGLLGRTNIPPTLKKILAVIPYDGDNEICKEFFPPWLDVPSIASIITGDSFDSLGPAGPLYMTHIALPIDGIVFKIADPKYREILGETAKFPRWAIAFKFASDHAETIVREVRLQVTRHGFVVPTAVMDPVEIGGVVVRHASLHNYDEILRKDIRVGDSVLVVRAGDVIPYIKAVVDPASDDLRSPRFVPPDTCPSCGGGLVDIGGGMRKCAAYHTCRDQILARLNYAVSKEALDVRGIGPAAIAALYDNGLIDSQVSSLFTIDERMIYCSHETIGSSRSSLERYVAYLESKMGTLVKREKVILSLGIPDVGAETARLVSPYIQDDGTVLQPELLNVRDVGPEIVNSIVSHFSDSKKRDDLLNLLAVLRVEADTPATALSGASVVFSGVFSSGDRKKMEESATRAGYVVRNDVSKNTDYLVIGNKPSQGKIGRARKNNISILTEEEWLERMKPSNIHPYITEL